MATATQKVIVLDPVTLELSNTLIPDSDALLRMPVGKYAFQVPIGATIDAAAIAQLTGRFPIDPVDATAFRVLIGAS